MERAIHMHMLRRLVMPVIIFLHLDLLACCNCSVPSLSPLLSTHLLGSLPAMADWNSALLYLFLLSCPTTSMGWLINCLARSLTPCIHSTYESSKKIPITCITIIKILGSLKCRISGAANPQRQRQSFAFMSSEGLRKLRYNLEVTYVHDTWKYISLRHS